MRKAIITGANGLLGNAVAKYLVSQGVDVLCLGRKDVSAYSLQKSFGTGAAYLCLSMEEIDLLPLRMKQIGWEDSQEAVFFHFAWSGATRLADGELIDQLKNVALATKSIEIARHLGCSKFVNAGTVLESFVDAFLNGCEQDQFSSSQANYALAKVASRDMCKMVSYLQKIDYVHTRLSVPIALDLSRGGYISSTLEKISQGKNYDDPREVHLFDLVSVDDAAIAYYLIGNSGSNKSDYFIGTGRPETLTQIFSRFKKLIETGVFVDTQEVPDGCLPQIKFYDAKPLQTDLGFIASSPLLSIAKMVNKS